MRKILPACLVLLAAGCDVAQDIQQRKAEEKAKVEANELKERVEQPMDRARNADAPVIEADKQREDAIKDAGG